MSVSAPLRAVLRQPNWPRSLRRGLAEHWKLDDVNGALAGVTLTNNNVATFGAGLVGDAVTLALASSQYLSVADSATVSTGDIDFSLAAWVNLASKPASVMRIAGQWDNTTGRGYLLDWNNGNDNFRVLIGDGAGGSIAVRSAVSFGAPEIGAWYLVYGFHSAAHDLAGISVNGGLFDTAATSGAAGDSSSPFAIGCDFGSGTPTRFWDGQIDEVLLWKHRPPLSQGELRWLFNAGRGRVGPF